MTTPSPAPSTLSKPNLIVLVILAILNLAGLAIAAVQVLAYLTRHEPLFMLDYGAYYISGAILNSPTPVLYDDHLAGLISAARNMPFPPPRYIYPPFFAVMHRPLALLPFPVAGLAWMLVNTVLVGVSVRLLLPIVKWPRDWKWVAMVTAAVITIPVVYANIILAGQSNIVILALLVITYVYSRPDRLPRDHMIAGLAIGGMVGIKFYMIVLAPYFVLYRRPRIALWAAVGFALTTVVGLLGAGWQNTLRYYTTVFLDFANEAELDRVHHVFAWYNYNLGATVARLFASSDASFQYFFSKESTSAVIPALLDAPAWRFPAYQITRGLFVGLTAAILALDWLRQRRYGVSDVEPAIGLLVVTTVLALPLGWQATHVVDLLAVALLLAVCYASVRATNFTISGLLLSDALLLLHMNWPLLYLALGGISPLVLATGTLSVLVIWLMLAARIWQSDTGRQIERIAHVETLRRQAH